MLPEFQPYRELRRRAGQIAVGERRARRELEATACLLRHGAGQFIERTFTPGYAIAEPEVTIAVSLYDYAGVVAEALHSAAASVGVAFEIVVVDDHSRDPSVAVVREWMGSHPDVPILLLAKQANEGLEAARNTAFEAARAPLVMVLDADNMVSPHGIAHLRDVLVEHPDAAGAYGPLREFGEGSELRSNAPWDPAALCRGNYIDAQALLRREWWRRLGGYISYPDDVYGWEDWDLWLRLAAQGGYLAFTDREVGFYRVQRESMLSLTNLAHDDAVEAMRKRHPGLPWPKAGNP